MICRGEFDSWLAQIKLILSVEVGNDNLAEQFLNRVDLFHVHLVKIPKKAFVLRQTLEGDSDLLSH